MGWAVVRSGDRQWVGLLCGVGKDSGLGCCAEWGRPVGWAVVRCGDGQ